MKQEQYLEEYNKRWQHHPLQNWGGSVLSLSCGVSRYDFCSPVLDAISNSDQGCGCRIGE